MGTVNPVGYKANYSGLSAFDRPREGYAGNVILDTVDAYRKQKESDSIQRYRAQQQEKLQQDMAMKDAEQQGAIDYMNKTLAKPMVDKQGNQLPSLGSNSAQQSPMYDRSNMGASTMQDYLTQKQRVVSNEQSDRTYNLNVGKATKPETIGESFKDADGKWYKKTKTFNPTTNSYDYGKIKSTDLEALQAIKSAKTKSREPFSEYSHKAIMARLDKDDLTYTDEAYKAKLDNPTFMDALRSKYASAQYDISPKIGKEGELPTVKYPNTKVGSKSYANNQVVDNKFGNYTAYKTPDGKSTALQYTGEKTPPTLQDHVSQLEKKDQAHYAKLIEEGNDNFMFDKFSADKLYHLSNQLSGGNPKMTKKFFESYVSGSLRSGGLGTAIATSAFVPSFDYSDFSLDPKMDNAKEALASANMNLYAWALANDKIRVDKEGGIDEKTGLYDFVLLDEKGQPVPKAQAQDAYRKLYNENRQAVSSWSIDTEESMMDKAANEAKFIGENLPFQKGWEMLKSGYDKVFN